MVIFYGTQTGTAEEFAIRLAKESNRLNMKALVADPEECDFDELIELNNIEKALVLFCMATYGEGDPTDNAIEFNEWLKNASIDLTGINYAVIYFYLLKTKKNYSLSSFTFIFRFLVLAIKLMNTLINLVNIWINV